MGTLALLALLVVLPWASSAQASGVNPPAATTGSALNVEKTSAELTAVVNPLGPEVTECEFDYGTSEGALSSKVKCSSLPPAGGAPEAVSAAVNGLEPNTTYYFKIVATTSEGTGEGEPVSFKTVANAPAATSKPAREVKLASALLVGSVNPEGAPATCEFKYWVEGSPEKTAPCSFGAGEEVTAQVEHLTPETTYHFRVVAEGEGGKDESAAESFTTLADELTVTTGAASATMREAVLKGTLSPGASPVTSCQFQYGTTKGDLKSTAACSEPLPGAGVAVEVSAKAMALIPNTTYYFKLVADNEAEAPQEGAESQFKTSRNPPRVTTGEATGIGQTIATLAGTVNPEGEEMKGCAVEYGTTPSLGSSAPCASLPATVETPVEVTIPLAGLSPGTTYYYKLTAESTGGAEVGLEPGMEPKTFTTLPATQPPPPPPPPGGGPGPPKGPEAAKPPVISSLSESNSVFRVGRSSTPPAGRISRASPTGTVFSFVLDQPAVVTVTFFREESGHQVGKSCVVGRRGAGKPACVRSYVAMMLGRRARNGLNRLLFTGRVRGRALHPGAYRATFIGESLAGSSIASTISFRVVAH